MSTSTLTAALLATLLATGWLLSMGAIRMIAYRSGEVDHTPGMRNVAILALVLGGISAIACLTFAAMLLSR